jgi:hypothetical protein
MVMAASALGMFKGDSCIPDLAMKTRTKLIGLIAAALTVGIVYAALSEQPASRFGAPFMHHGMMGARMGPKAGFGPGRMGADHDSATTGQLQDIHTLFIDHDRIRRTVTNLANGIRTETTSDDPRIATLIKNHVGAMGRRVEAGDDPGLPIESAALHAIFRDKDKISTRYETTANGIVVVQTSDDRKVVAELQEHASQVTEFVDKGMEALHTAMQKNFTGMMPPMGRGGMMHDHMGPGIMEGPM